MLDFARSLPKIRKQISRDIADGELSRGQVLACGVRMLDSGLFRIGSEQYAERNGSYGLATMREEHVSLNGTQITFDYPAKSGQKRVQSIIDPDVRAIVSALKRRRGGGPELLADFSAKDFRTWNATMLAAVALGHDGLEATTANARKRAISRAVKAVAFFLGNTPAVCRASYIDPRVFDRYLSGWTIGGAIAKIEDPADIARPSTRRTVEKAVLDLITEKHSPALEKVGVD
jgi:DNA topoisomerase-1